MNLAFLLLSCTLVAGDEPVLLDAFHYTDAKTATAEWKPQGVAEVGVSTAKDGGIELALPFAAKPGLERVIIDRKLNLDLSGRREFTLDVEPDNMEAVGEVMIYFKSGEGWYGCGIPLRRPGPQTLRFVKASFRGEGRPTGWEHVDGIRISVWRGMGVNSSLHSAIWWLGRGGQKSSSRQWS